MGGENNDMIDKISFFHIPKCAGQSLSKALSGRQFRHKNIKDKYWDKFRSDFFVTFVRHPLERLVSLHSWLRTLKDHPGRCGGSEMMMAFGVMARSFDCDEFWKNLDWISADIVNPFFRPITYFTDSLNHFDFVGRVESLEEDVKKLEDVCGKKFIIFKKNQSNHRSWRDEFSGETLKRLMKRYGGDFDLCGYEKPDII